MPKSKEFVEDSSSGSSDEEPKPKKQKAEKKPEKKPEKKEKKEKPRPASDKDDSDNEEEMISLAKMRFASVSTFHGKTFVNIREYYDKDGEMRPGKKGISLSPDQWEKLKAAIPILDKRLKKA